ncbi:hypothetical protein [Kribbella sp. NPDC049227]|uniref:hypothetical protein n=1 Tax=Kribbella sp. NPDC049227 TaxID=3364113 RepID=UPI003719A19C
MTSSLQQEIARWEAELDRIAENSVSDGWDPGERRLAESQHTIAAYRGHVLPSFTSERLYDAIVADELTHLVERLEDLRNDLFRITDDDRDTHQLIAETLASVRTLAHLAIRFDQAVEAADLPRVH